MTEYTYHVGVARYAPTQTHAGIYDWDDNHIADVMYAYTGTFAAVPAMLDALADVERSGLIECCCGEDPCCGSCTITLVRDALKAAGT